MKRVVSVSLGSSGRDKRVETVLLGQPIVLERLGTDGDQARMRRLFQELDGRVDAFGFGGADLGFTVQGRYYPLHSVRGLVEGVRTPVVDGGGLRALVERRIAQRLDALLPLPISPKRVLHCVGVARYDMVCSFLDAGYQPLFGDLGFGLGLPIPLRRLSTCHLLARLMLPVMSRLPLAWLYPTGERQDRIEPKFEGWYEWATVIADDFHYIKQHLPDRLEGKIVVTNTTTEADLELLRRRGVAAVCTTTPRIDGRSFGTNLMEAALTALAGRGRPLSPAELAELVDDDDLSPTVTLF